MNKKLQLQFVVVLKEQNPLWKCWCVVMLVLPVTFYFLHNSTIILQPDTALFICIYNFVVDYGTWHISHKATCWTPGIHLVTVMCISLQ